MRGTRKTYVIDPVSKKVSVDMFSSSRDRDDGKGVPGHPRSSGSDGRKNSGETKMQTNDKRSGISILLSYLLGPLFIFAIRRGRRNKFWVGLSILSVILSFVFIWMWVGLSSWSTRETPAGAIILLTAVVAILSGASTWTRAVVLAGRYEGARIMRVSHWVKSSLATAAPIPR
jgi:hypothetical protein